jgi:hypothetical protein
MPDFGVHANLEALEGTSDGTVQTLTLKRKSRKLVIINDHSGNPLSYKFNDSEDFATLKGTEVLTLYFTTNQVIIQGTNCPYRIWVYG